MKKYRLFGEHVEVKCEYCAYSSNFDGVLTCSLGKERTEDGRCRKYSYDPLRRAPDSLPPVRRFDPKDFEL